MPSYPFIQYCTRCICHPKHRASLGFNLLLPCWGSGYQSEGWRWWERWWLRETRGGEEASTCLHTIYAVEYRRSAECSRSNSSSEMRYKNEGKVRRGITEILPDSSIPHRCLQLIQAIHNSSMIDRQHSNTSPEYVFRAHAPCTFRILRLLPRVSRSISVPYPLQPPT